MMSARGGLAKKVQQALAQWIMASMGKFPLGTRLSLSRSWLTVLPRSFFRWLVKTDGRQTVRVQSGPARGMWLKVDLIREGRTWIIGTYEPYVVATIATAGHSGMIAFDIGAHWGYYTLMLARLAGQTGQVYAFEPMPQNISRLREHVQLNGLHNVLINEVAVSETTGTATFYYWPDGNSTAGSIMSSSGFARQKVEPDELIVKTQSVDEVVNQKNLPRLDLIKIDAEGEEVRILRGMKQVLSTIHPTVICEFHSPELVLCGAELLTGYGYTLYDLQQKPQVPLTMADFVPSRTTLLARYGTSAPVKETE